MSMVFNYTEEQLTLQKTIRRFVENEIVPVRRQYDESEEFPWPEVRKMQDLGINCMVAPERGSFLTFCSVYTV